MAEKTTTANRRKNFLTAGQPIAVNKRARYEYALETPIEAGIQLTGSEVKSLRQGHVSIAEAYVGEKGGELYLLNAHIQEYPQAPKHLQHTPKRPRKLLLHRKEVDKFMGAIKREGYTIIPTRLYFNAKNMAKLEIALGKGKKLHDKRATEKSRDWGRTKQRLMRE
jgi:SsrA-binding protein